MVHIVITSWWPLHKSEEVQNKFNKTSQEMGQSPAIKGVNFYISSCKDGGKVVSYNEVEEGKLDEAFSFLARFLATYHDIEGYSYEFTFAYSATEIAAAQQS